MLRAVLRDGDYLLVLDNFEQVLPAAAKLADLLDACPNVKLLVTSRAVLGLPGEHVVDIRPFPLPPVRSPASDTDAVNFDACRRPYEGLPGWLAGSLARATGVGHA
jgi:non-specific serine/threonine protein kinase